MEKNYGMVIRKDNTDYVVMNSKSKGFAVVRNKQEMVKVFATSFHAATGPKDQKIERIRLNMPRLLELPDNPQDMKKYIVGRVAMKVLGNIFGAALNEAGSQELPMEDVTEDIINSDPKDYQMDPITKFIEAAREAKMEITGGIVGESKWKSGIGKEYYGLTVSHNGQRYIVVDGAFLGSVVDGAFLGSKDKNEVAEVLIELYHSEKDKEYAAQRIREINPCIIKFPDLQEDMDKYIQDDLQLPLFGFMQGGKATDLISEIEIENITERILTSEPIIDENLRQYTASGGKIL